MSLNKKKITVSIPVHQCSVVKYKVGKQNSVSLWWKLKVKNKFVVCNKPFFHSPWRHFSSDPALQCCWKGGWGGHKVLFNPHSPYVSRAMKKKTVSNWMSLQKRRVQLLRRTIFLINKKELKVAISERVNFWRNSFTPSFWGLLGVWMT